MRRALYHIVRTATYVVSVQKGFGAALRLRHSQPDTPRAYRIPGGTSGIWLVGGTGVLGSLFAFVIGFFPAD